MTTYVKAGIDGAGVAAIFGAIVGWLPAIGAFLAVIWYAFQIYESPTFAKLVAGLNRVLKRKQAIQAIQAAAPAPVAVIQPPPVVLVPAPVQSPPEAAPETAKPS